MAQARVECDFVKLIYSFLSATQGGWTMLSSEGRYMGAAAYGERDRLRNRYYGRLRELVRLLPGGAIRLDRRLANWPRRLFAEPYTPALEGVLGPPVSLRRLWNPDAILSVDDIAHAPATQDRVDKAAAVQALFEDMLVHILADAIERTGCDRLVLTGGTALNGVANMLLLETFDAAWYRRRLQRQARLQLWVPPVPGDAGVTIGAAYAFARRLGCPAGAPLDHAFHCGEPPTRAAIEQALAGQADIGWCRLDLPAGAAATAALAELMAGITAADGVLALFQGAAEMGPRALGHRSILANATNPQTRAILNARVKFREAIRPLAPMLTPAAARQLFELSDGAAAADHAAYNYMVLTARARPGTASLLPAVVHVDGTSRLQIVRQRHDPLCFAYLQALGRRLGVEAAVNTSFNVGGPIVQTPAQALVTLRRARGLDVLIICADDGTAFAAWHAVEAGEKDGGRRFGRWLAAWRMNYTNGWNG
jgi:carbamoyltransferase